MEQQQNMILSIKEKEQLESWSKIQVYEAYLTEHYARVELNIQLNKVNRTLAEIKFIAGGRS